MKIAIIGAGASGLCSLKYAIDDGYSCDVFEQTGSLGGTFVYNEATDFDENGFAVHTAMYKDLKINLPKEVMTYCGIPYPEQENSFVGQPEVLEYYENYADRFNLKKHIQFYKFVKKVELTEGTKWIVQVLDLKTKVEATFTYDAIFVCNGHYSSPVTPPIPGQDIFEGSQLHSYKYRFPLPFKDKRVLVIGSGPSGQDISLQISSVAKHVFVVVSLMFFGDMGSNMTQKPRVTRFCKNTAVFSDGTEEEVDIILYCTGYRYSIPFLGDSCKVTVGANQILPLYMHIVNIEHPTMFFIGLPNTATLTTPIWDLQARFALAAFGKKFRLPEKEEMMKDCKIQHLLKQETGNLAHGLMLINGETQRKYFQSLSDLSGIQNLPVVLTKIFDFHMENKLDKRISYKILDDETFEHHNIVSESCKKI